MDEWTNDSVNYEAVCITAPATPGLVKTEKKKKQIYVSNLKNYAYWTSVLISDCFQSTGTGV